MTILQMPQMPKKEDALGEAAAISDSSTIVGSYSEAYYQNDHRR